MEKVTADSTATPTTKRKRGNQVEAEDSNDPTATLNSRTNEEEGNETVDKDGEELDDGEEFAKRIRIYISKKKSTGGDDDPDGGDDSREEEVKAIKQALRSKTDWVNKIRNREIVKKYRQEAVQQGASSESVTQAVNELLDEYFASLHLSLRSTGQYLDFPKPKDEDEDEDEDDDEDDGDYEPKDEEDGKKDGKTKGKKADKEPESPYEEYDRDYRVNEEEDGEKTGGDRAEICYRKDIVPEELRASLEAKLDVIANADDKDFHPGSEDKVQDLVHPSLYPYVRGVSIRRQAGGGFAVESKEKVKSNATTTKHNSEEEADRKVQDEKDDVEEEEQGSEKQNEDNEDDSEGEVELSKEQEEMLASYEDEGLMVDEERRYLSELKKLEGWDSIYQWLPAEYLVNAFGEARIVSYINNLDRNVHAELYNDIAKVFEYFVPMFEVVLGSSLRRKRLQVVTKAANYVLKPGASYEGVWHVEGMKHERIVASGIYYYSTTRNLVGSSLAFREKRDDSYHSRSRTHSLNFSRNLGRVTTPMGRCLVFTNDLQHKVKLMTNNSDTMGYRKILCFFLVDPDERIPSAVDVPEQQWDRVKCGYAQVLEQVANHLHTPLPPELIEHIVALSKHGFTLEEAKEHRLALMKERKYYVDINNRQWERSFSFCEH